MDDKNITLQEAIEQVDQWLSEADKRCTTSSRENPWSNYEKNVHDWNAYKNVALLLAKVRVPKARH